MDIHIYIGSDEYDREIIEHGFTNDTLRSFLYIGYELYKHRVLRQLDDLVESNIESIVESRVRIRESDISSSFMKTIEDLKKENLDLVRQIENNELARQYELDLEKQNLKIEHLDCLLRESKMLNTTLETKLDALYKDLYKDSIQQLKDTIKQRENEICILKNTNTVKGNMGENHIATTLQNIFTDCDITKTGKVAHVCDVHMTLPTSKSIAFESKYKSIITKGDVDKFYNDVENLGESVIGGVFVSFLSKNIPNKGSINFEITTQNKKPLMYLAYEDEHEFNMYFTQNVVMFVKLCEAYAKDTKTTLDINNTINQIKFIGEMITKQKKRLDDIKQKFAKYVQESDEDIKTMLDRMQNVIEYIPSISISSSTCNEPKRKKTFACSKCQFTCATQKTLIKHVSENKCLTDISLKN